ncbi:MAG: NADH:ubiquinone oxidoreductase [Candidatus Nanoarchaeia archaeon]
MKQIKKPVVGVFGVSGCAGCMLTMLFEDNFKELVKLFDIKSFPLIKQDKYKGEFDFIFIEGTVCFDEDIIVLNELRKRAKKVVALGSCACFGGVPSIKNFLDSEKTMHFVYPKYNHLKTTSPTPISSHIKVDYFLPQCPPSKTELLEFLKNLALGLNFKNYQDPVCFECRKKSNPCLLEEGKICLGPVTNGGCEAICPSNKTTCYGCRGPCADANYKAFISLLKEKGYNQKEIQDKMQTFAGLAFEEEEAKTSTWLEEE